MIASQNESLLQSTVTNLSSSKKSAAASIVDTVANMAQSSGALDPRMAVALTIAKPLVTTALEKLTGPKAMKAYGKAGQEVGRGLTKLAKKVFNEGEAKPDLVDIKNFAEKVNQGINLLRNTFGSEMLDSISAAIAAKLDERKKIKAALIKKSYPVRTKSELTSSVTEFKEAVTALTSHPISAVQHAISAVAVVNDDAPESIKHTSLKTVANKDIAETLVNQKIETSENSNSYYTADLMQREIVAVKVGLTRPVQPRTIAVLKRHVSALTKLVKEFNTPIDKMFGKDSITIFTEGRAYGNMFTSEHHNMLGADAFTPACPAGAYRGHPSPSDSFYTLNGVSYQGLNTETFWVNPFLFAGTHVTVAAHSFNTNAKMMALRGVRQNFNYCLTDSDLNTFDYSGVVSTTSQVELQNMARVCTSLAMQSTGTTPATYWSPFAWQKGDNTNLPYPVMLAGDGYMETPGANSNFQQYRSAFMYIAPEAPSKFEFAKRYGQLADRILKVRIEILTMDPNLEKMQRTTELEGTGGAQRIAVFPGFAETIVPTHPSGSMSVPMVTHSFGRGKRDRFEEFSLWAGTKQLEPMPGGYGFMVRPSEIKPSYRNTTPCVIFVYEFTVSAKTSAYESIGCGIQMGFAGDGVSTYFLNDVKMRYSSTFRSNTNPCIGPVVVTRASPVVKTVGTEKLLTHAYKSTSLANLNADGDPVFIDDDLFANNVVITLGKLASDNIPVRMGELPLNTVNSILHRLNVKYPSSYILSGAIYVLIAIYDLINGGNDVGGYSQSAMSVDGWAGNSKASLRLLENLNDQASKRPGRIPYDKAVDIMPATLLAIESGLTPMLTEWMHQFLTSFSTDSFFDLLFFHLRFPSAGAYPVLQNDKLFSYNVINPTAELNVTNDSKPLPAYTPSVPGKNPIVDPLKSKSVVSRMFTASSFAALARRRENMDISEMAREAANVGIGI